MLIKINDKKHDLLHYALNPFFTFTYKKSLEKYSQKNENWTIINVHFSENHRRIQNEVSEIILLFLNSLLYFPLPY